MKTILQLLLVQVSFLAACKGGVCVNVPPASFFEEWKQGINDSVFRYKKDSKLNVDSMIQGACYLGQGGLRTWYCEAKQEMSLDCGMWIEGYIFRKGNQIGLQGLGYRSSIVVFDFDLPYEQEVENKLSTWQDLDNSTLNDFAVRLEEKYWTSRFDTVYKFRYCNFIPANKDAFGAEQNVVFLLQRK